MGKFNYLWFRNILLLSAGMWGLAMPYAVADDKMKESPITEQVRTKIQVSGVVVDSNGEPLIGATIREKESGNGTITDVDGKFTLSIPVDAVIVISYVGYRDKLIAVNGKTSFKIELEDDTETLGEVVVVGYGIQKKANLSGSVDQITSTQLEQRPMTDLSKGLQGMVPNLNVDFTSGEPGQAANINIRGEASISGGSPLILIDGVASDAEEMNRLLPEDVESLSVLKDASSAAIYGARGSNGVILISSKRGEKGKLTVSYNTYITIDNPINFPNLMNGAEFWKYKTEALKDANTTPPTESNPEPWMGSMPATELRMHEAGMDTDWLDLATRTGFKQQHNISFRGGVNKTNYFVSLNYTDVKGTAVGNQFKRYNIRFNLDQEFTSWFKFSTSTQLGRYDRSGSSASFSRAFRMNPLAEAYDEEGNIRSAAWEDSSEAFSVNPLSSLNNKSNDIRSKVITNNVVEIK